VSNKTVIVADDTAFVRDRFATALVGAGLMAAMPAFALDGSKTDGSIGPPPMTPVEAFRSGAHWLKAGDTVKAVNSLEYAAEKGHALAQWKLGRMYAEGDGVAQNDLKAFEYFRSIANSHADDNPDTPQARFVANAFVALGHYYLEGIPKAEIKRDPQRAREMFAYAASYFRDPDAQYYLARLYLNGTGAPHDPRTAARWFGLSAQKGQCEAQAMLGAMLFGVRPFDAATFAGARRSCRDSGSVRGGAGVPRDAHRSDHGAPRRLTQRAPPSRPPSRAPGLLCRNPCKYYPPITRRRNPSCRAMPLPAFVLFAPSARRPCCCRSLHRRWLSK